jgi:hypothetical protein
MIECELEAELRYNERPVVELVPRITLVESVVQTLRSEIARNSGIEINDRQLNPGTMGQIEWKARMDISSLRSFIQRVQLDVDNIKAEARGELEVLRATLRQVELDVELIRARELLG